MHRHPNTTGNERKIMRTSPMLPEDLRTSVIAVPPLARDAQGEISSQENRRLISYLEAGGVRSLLYGGNAVFYHLRPSEFASTLELLAQATGPQTFVVPSVGPSYGLMLDQADILRDFDFPTAMLLPQKEIVDPQGIARGITDLVARSNKPAVLYLKHDRWLPVDLVGKLYRDGLISWIKYAVVRDRPDVDLYLSELLEEVPAERIVSGIGEQPAIVHRKLFGLAGFTTGCGCVAPRLSMRLLAAMNDQDWDQSESIRIEFEPLESLRNAIHPIRVLHEAVAQADIAKTGPIQPMLAPLEPHQQTPVAQAAVALRHQDER
jgi:dihydrodipicolinate synthase/N-acetylneuraminate lyase